MVGYQKHAFSKVEYVELHKLVELRKLECRVLQTTKLNRETNNVKSTIGVEKLETGKFNCRCRYKL